MNENEQHLFDITSLITMSIEALDPDRRLALNDRLSELLEAIVSRELTNPGLGSSVLSTVFDLSRTETHVLWLLAAANLHQGARVALMQTFGGDSPDLATIKQLIYGRSVSTQAFSELGPSGTLRRLGLIERSDGKGDQHESRWTWAISYDVLGWMHGQPSLAPLLEEICSIHPGMAKPPLSGNAHSLSDLHRMLSRSDSVIGILGQRGSGRRSMLCAALASDQRRTLAVRCERLSKTLGILENQLSAIARASRLHRCIVLLEDLDLLRHDERLETLLTLAPRLFPKPIVFTATATERFTVRIEGLSSTVVDLGLLTAAQRASLWHDALGQGTQEDADLLADAFPMSPALIVAACESAKRHAAEPNRLQPNDIFAGISAVANDALSLYARRISTSQDWGDLVLPSDVRDTVVELVARVKERRKVYESWGFARKVGKGLGISALFSGPPGTGKTMVATLIARELSSELYQVDLSKIASKWIGETEKNLSALFDAAESACSILLFDEADSLFGKRTEVKSSNDRYANFETNYLLQRLESYSGVCLLTTNHESNIDPAFQRRLSLHLRFALPDEPERLTLWKTMIPNEAPVGNIDFDRLAAKFLMSGGYIRNAVLRAAFMAANDRGVIEQHHLERGALLEYEAMGKLA